MDIKTKIIAVLTVAAFVLPGISFAQTTTIPTIASLQAEIQSLVAELQTLELQAGGRVGITSTSTIPGEGSGPALASTSTVAVSGPSPALNSCYTFSSNLGMGSTGNGVEDLQNALEAKGFPVSVTGNYNQQTANEVTNFQESYASQILAPNGLQTGTGYVGRSTREVLNALFGCGPARPVGPTPTSTPPIMCPGGGIPSSTEQCPPLPTRNPTPLTPCVTAPGSTMICIVRNPLLTSPATTTPPCVVSTGGSTNCLPTGPSLSSSTASLPVVTSVNPPSYGLSQFSYGAITITVNGSGFTAGNNTVNFQEGSGPLYEVYDVLSSDGKTLAVNTGNMVVIQTENGVPVSTMGSLPNAVPTVPGTYNLSITNANGTSVAIPVVINQ